MNRAIGVGFVLMLFLVSAIASDSEWRKYENKRFGFVLTYPKALIAGPEAMNGDGREFHTTDHEFSLAASAHFFVPDSGDSFDGRWKEELETPGARITYKKKTGTWYVVSGIASDGTEYYHKLFRKGANWAGFQITYPHLKNKKYDSWVVRIEKSFVPFREGDFDRLD